MTVGELISEFERAGIRVWREGRQLRFRAPRGAMTDERLVALRGRKEQLLSALPDQAPTAGTETGAPAAPGTGWTAEPENRHDPFPLTDIQSAYLLGRDEAFDYGGVSCHIYLEFRRPVDLDPERLQQAWNSLVDRHDMLRSVIAQDGTQRIAPTLADTRIQVADLRGASAEAASEATATVREELSHRVHPAGERPMYAIRLTRLDDHCLLHLSMDFMVLDWISIQLLLTELDHRYERPGCPLSPIDATFRDYVAAERRLRGTERYARDHAYWWDRVDDLPAAPALPLADGHTPADAPPRFRRLEASLTEGTWRALKTRAAAHGITAANAVLAAYAETIGRWSAADRFTVGLTVLNRMPLHPHVERLLGDFTSVSLLAVDQSKRAAFADRARGLGEQLFEDLDHRLCGGVEVLRELARRRGREAALMPVVFTGGIGVARRALGDGAERLRPVYGISQTPQVWIDCQATDQFGGLEVNWDIREGVFPDGLVDDMFAAFTGLLSRLAEQAAPWTAADPLGLPARQRARRDAVNATAAPEPGGLLHEPLVAYARRFPGRTAVVDATGVLTYGEWLGRAARVAGELRAAGCRPGDFVAVLMDKGRDQVVGVLGALLAGGVYVPVDITQPQVRRDRILTSCRARYAVISDAAPTLTLPNGCCPVNVSSAEPLLLSEVPDERLVAPGDFAYVIHTSGSTGEPKGVMISHRAAANTVHDINQRFAVGDTDRVLGLAALSFDLSVYDLFGPTALGAALVLPDPSRRGDPSHWADLMEHHGVTLWNSVPAQLQMLAHYLDAEPRKPNQLRLALLSGDWIPLALPAHAGRHLPGAELVSLGGATEAAIWSIHHRIRRVEPHWRSVPYGTPLANQGFRVLDSSLRDRPDLAIGELYITGVGLAEGYLNDPELTAERFLRHPETGERLYRTGDLGRYLPDGEIEFLGRADQQVKIRGHRVELGEIDAVLGEHPAVGASVVLVEGTEALERSLVAFVESVVRADPPASSVARAVAAGAAAVSALPLEDGAPSAGQVAAYVDRLNRAFLLSMADALAPSGLFAGQGACEEEELIRRLRIDERHHGLLRRWLHTLERAGLVRAEPGENAWLGLNAPHRTEADQAWADLAAHAPAEICPPPLLAYFRAHADNLPALLRGEEEAVRLFFPGGSQEVARAWYADNLAARRLLTTLGAAVAGAASGVPDRPLRVLEVGGGIGAATGPVLDALGDRPVDYLFTDVSEFFLADARQRFGARPGMRFGLFDMNQDPRSQGLLPNSFDVVVSAGALNNARDTPQVLDQLRTLLAPRGWLCLLEMTREHPEITATQAFMMEEPEDLRRKQASLFVHEEQWRRLLAEAGAADVLSLPGQDDPFAPLGQGVFAASFKQDRAELDADDIGCWVAARLPAHMVPAHIQVVDALPLTSNGKVDRKRLLGWVPRHGERAADRTAEPPRPGLERRVAELWAELLGSELPDREQGFFDAGGDSLVAARLVGRVRECVPEAANVSFDVLLRTLLHTPTVAGLAGRLTTRPDPGTGTDGRTVGRADRRSALFELGRGGTGPLRLLVHEGLGTLAPYRPLIKELAADGPLVGLAVPDSNGYLELAPHRLVEDLAAQYAREVLAAGHREVEVVGYCSGGLIAAELARALGEGGAVVRGLTVVSSYRIPYRLDDELMVDYTFARVMGGDLEALGWPADDGDMGWALAAALTRSPKALDPGIFAQLDGDERLKAVANRFRLLGERPREERREALHRALASTEAGLSDVGQVAALHRVFEHTVEAVTHYDPLPYAGDITFLRPLEPTHFIPGFQDDMTRFWRELCLGELTVVDVPGDHFSCVQPPHVARTAAALTRRSGVRR
ncbi:non-ribosomal peptide synthetase [Streptomyces kronopolitis]|uniref:non-ribosomal peptide synthetase n=1 Tax=Streptomyces kronopolitis TaxID=1612435 RepID=UPI0020C00C9F|nr:non-ribosomal peptide synthetase [Streptomyces kronopolitis]MCL6296872.1 amino acid adenylation domain-containing protein [Streptomyces kronopolitis]